jgi:phage tail sheath gpL-like
MTVSTAYPSNRVARGVAIKESYDPNIGAAGTRFRPVHIAVVGQGEDGVTYASDKRQVFSSYEAGSVYGFKSPIYGVCSELFRQGSDVGDIPVDIYPLQQPAAGNVNAAGSITPSGTYTTSETYQVKVNNILSDEFTTATGETVATLIDKMVAAVNAVIGMPGTAADGTTVFNFTAGWEGVSGNDAAGGIHLEMVSPDSPDFTFVIVQPINGAGTVATAAALTLLDSDVWTTHVINCLEPTNSTAITAFNTMGDARRLPECKKPLTVYTGTNSSMATAYAITDALKAEKVSIFVPNPQSKDLQFRIAAAWVREIAKIDNIDPACDYCGAQLKGLTVGSVATEWASSLRQTAVLKGLSTVEVKDGIVCISDTVTTYHPSGEEPPGYRYVCDIAKVSTAIYNTDLIFNSATWNGKPLIPNSQASRNPNAKKPKMAMAQIFMMIDNLADDAIISDPAYAKANSSASIDSTNAKRLNVKFVFKLSGNANVISIDLAYGFYNER